MINYLGLSNFDEPFTARRLFEYGEFRENYIIKFSIQTR
jgi:hypothetical protein